MGKGKKERRAAALTAGVDMWGYFAHNLYAHPVSVIAVRELYQNGRDACRRAGRLPKIVIVVVVTDDGYGRITCRDNGCGMDEDTILDRFLRLGGTDKAAGDTGGFGIAKAVIIGGCTHWEVRTHDLHVSMDHVRKGLPIDTGFPWLDGTRVVLRYDPLPEHDSRHRHLRIRLRDLAAALSWLAHNDSPCTVVLKHGQGRPQIWRFDGVRPTSDTLVSEGRLGRTTWRLHQIPPQNKNITPIADGPPIPSTGKLFVRLHGLVQFTGFSTGEHPDCWILDLETRARPTDPDYPLSLSREGMNPDLSAAVWKSLEPHIYNPISSHSRRFRAADRPITLVFSGRWLGRSCSLPDPRMPSPSVEREAGTFRLSVFEQAAKIVRPGASPLGYAVMVKGANSSTNVFAPHKLRLLEAWARIVELVARAGEIWEQFGVGFLYDADDLAERVVSPDGVFYLVNPRLAGLAVSRPREALLKMFGLAAHELAHERYPNHGEGHSSRMGELMLAAAGEFIAGMDKMVKELRKKPRPPSKQLRMPFVMRGG
ncbi:MAG TPA: ATP-binding protein [Anaerolineae bacterium]|nr:ATP-binding protein [Anaerolineae bacterium]